MKNPPPATEASDAELERFKAWLAINDPRPFTPGAYSYQAAKWKAWQAALSYPAAAVGGEDRYKTMYYSLVEAFDKYAQPWLREDGDGGFAGTLMRMATAATPPAGGFVVVPPGGDSFSGWAAWLRDHARSFDPYIQRPYAELLAIWLDEMGLKFPGPAMSPTAQPSAKDVVDELRRFIPRLVSSMNGVHVQMDEVEDGEYVRYDDLPQPPSRESQMVVVERNAEGTPTVWCDPEIVDLVAALNKGGIPTVASCSGHGVNVGNIALRDGRELFISPDFASAREFDAKLSAKDGVRVELLSLPEDGAYLIRYDDQDEDDEMFAYSGARENALRRYRDRSLSWNAHLFVKIDSNSRDCDIPNATTASGLVDDAMVERATSVYDDNYGCEGQSHHGAMRAALQSVWPGQQGEEIPTELQDAWDAIDDVTYGPLSRYAKDVIARYLTPGMKGHSRIIGSRTIDGVHVIIAKPASDLMPEQLLVRYDTYLSAIGNKLQALQAIVDYEGDINTPIRTITKLRGIARTAITQPPAGKEEAALGREVGK